VALSGTDLVQALTMFVAFDVKSNDTNTDHNTSVEEELEKEEGEQQENGEFRTREENDSTDILDQRNIQEPRLIEEAGTETTMNEKATGVGMKLNEFNNQSGSGEQNKNGKNLGKCYVVSTRTPIFICRMGKGVIISIALMLDAKIALWSQARVEANGVDRVEKGLHLKLWRKEAVAMPCPTCCGIGRGATSTRKGIVPIRKSTWQPSVWCVRWAFMTSSRKEWSWVRKQQSSELCECMIAFDCVVRRGRRMGQQKFAEHRYCNSDVGSSIIIAGIIKIVLQNPEK
jgi:hypothetical protein